MKALGSKPDVAAKGDTQNVEQLPEEGKNILLGIISQLRPGMDLSKVTLPTFVLEPRSMLERITNFMSHPELLNPIPTIPDPEKRFIEVVRFYMTGFYIQPPGVKKPLNPVLGEYFSGKWDFEEGKEAYYIAEQVSHHPPKSAYFYVNPYAGIWVDGVLKPKSRFLGNSAGTITEGKALLKFYHLNETYVLTQPNIYARGILFGRMKLELGDNSMVRCDTNDLIAEIEFKTKGFISGTYNAIFGIIKRISTGQTLYEIFGKWNEQMFIKNVSTGEINLLFDAVGAQYTSVQPYRPLEKQGEKESQRLWERTIAAIKQRDQTAATEAKSFVEDRQREEAKGREQLGLTWHPRFFRPVFDDDGDFYILREPIDLTQEPSAIAAQVQRIIQ